MTNPLFDTGQQEWIAYNAARAPRAPTVAGPQMYTTTRFQLELPEFAERVDVRVLDTAYEKLDLDAAHLRLGYDQNVFLPNPVTGVAGGISFGAPTARIFAPGTGGRDDIGVVALNGEVNVSAASDARLVSNTYWDGSTWQPINPSQSTGIWQVGWNEVSYATSPYNTDPNISTIRFRVAADTGMVTAERVTLRSAPSPGGVPTVLLGTPGNNNEVGYYDPALLVATFTPPVVIPPAQWTDDGTNIYPATGANSRVIIGSNLRAESGNVYFEASQVVMIRWRGDLGALEAPYGNGFYSTQGHFAGGVWGGNVYAHGGTVYLEGGNNVFMQWRADLNAVWFGWAGGTYTSGPGVYTGALSAPSLVIAGWAIGTAVSVGGDIRCSGGLWADGNVLHFAAGAVRWSWDGTFIRSTHHIYSDNKISAADQITGFGSWSMGNGNCFLTPNVNDNRGQGLAFEWRIHACVDHAIQYGLMAEPVADPLASVRAIQGYHYDHISFAPVPGYRPILTKDGTPESHPTYGFRASEVAAALPEMSDGESVSATRMLTILWEALKQYTAATDARLAALEGATP